MIKHIVLWTLHDTANGETRQANALRLKQQLEALNGKIPQLLLLEVGIHVADSHASPDDADVVLYSEFESMEALEAYYVHPEHQKIIPFAKSIRRERRVINYLV